jgi:hypothetical protein
MDNLIRKKMKVIDLPKTKDVFIVSNRQYLFLKENNVLTEDNNGLRSTYSRKSILAMIDMIPKSYRLCD